jgi:hypothetical protein
VPQIGFCKQVDGVHEAIALEWNGSNRKCPYGGLLLGANVWHTRYSRNESVSQNG